MSDFYVRYYTGHQGRHGHEFLEFEYSRGRLRYANNSNYRNDSLIRKESTWADCGLGECVWKTLTKGSICYNTVWLGPLVVEQIRQLVEESEIMKEDDAKWPRKNVVGRQELEVRLGSEHISFETAKIGALVDVQDSDDPEGLRVFYYLVQDLKCLIFSLINLHFKIKPI